MKTILIVLLLLSLAGWEMYIRAHTLDEAMQVCEKNDGLAYISLSDDTKKGTKTPIWIKAHCNNGAMFKLSSQEKT